MRCGGRYGRERSSWFRRLDNKSNPSLLSIKLTDSRRRHVCSSAYEPHLGDKENSRQGLPPRHMAAQPVPPNKGRSRSSRKIVPRPPPPSSAAISNSMRSNRPEATGPEVSLRRALWTVGSRGFRLNTPGLPGRPDIVFRRSRVAVFVNGCFWHRCPIHGRRLPVAHREYWELKFRLNVRRDKEKRRLLEAMGWRVLVVWECEVREHPVETALRIRGQLRARAPV
jgi:DNA mismatch endonuclease (patch repair protein)